RREEQHRRNTRRGYGLRILDQLIHRELANPRHARHGVSDAAPGDGEQRINEGVGREPRLADHTSPRVRLARATGPCCWMTHTYLWAALRVRAASLRCRAGSNGVQARTRQAAQGGRFGQRWGVSALHQRAGRGGTDRDGRRPAEQTREIFLTERALKLRNSGRTCERDCANAVTRDPRAAVVDIERCPRGRTVGLDSRDLRAELSQTRSERRQGARAGGIENAGTAREAGCGKRGYQARGMGLAGEQVDRPAVLLQHGGGGAADG